MAIWVSKGPGGLSLKTNPMIGTQEIDVFVTEEHSYTSTTPTHVVEDGSTVSDMVVKEPITVTVEGIVSVSSTASNSKNDVTPERADNAYAVLKQLNRTGTPVKVVTSLEVYENMVVTSFIPKRGKGTGDALRFTATFTQVTLAKTEFITEKKVAKKASSATKKRVVSPTKTTSPGYVWTLNYPGNYQLEAVPVTVVADNTRVASVPGTSGEAVDISKPAGRSYVESSRTPTIDMGIWRKTSLSRDYGK